MNSFLKFSLGLGVVVLIAAAALYILGSERGRHTTSLVIDAPPATVFTYLTESEQLKKWVDGLVEIEPLGDLTNEVGARSRVTSKSNDRMVEAEEKIIRYQQDELYSVQSTNEFRVQTSRFELEPKDNQTKLTYRVVVANRGLGKILGVFAQTPIQEQIESDARRLKELIEGHPLPPTIDEAEFSGAVSTETATPAATTGPDGKQ
jgi:uncharacterized protein YndB with AHSA1/START domain